MGTAAICNNALIAAEGWEGWLVDGPALNMKSNLVAELGDGMFPKL